MTALAEVNMRIPLRKKSSGFSLVELLVVIGIIAVLIGILLPTLGRIRRSAKTTQCMSNLREWGNLFAMYHSDSRGRLEPSDQVSMDGFWPGSLIPYLRGDKRLLLCPVAEEPKPAGSVLSHRGATNLAWNADGTFDESFIGSYGHNGWAASPRQTVWWFNLPVNQTAWRNLKARQSNNIPLLFDSAWFHILPLSNDAPPPARDDIEIGSQMAYACLDRHKGKINVLFLDSSVRSVGLQKLWELKWNPTFNTAGPWTKAGGVQPTAWPEWMRKFTD